MTDTSVLAPANAVAPETISTFDSAAPSQPQADTSAPSVRQSGPGPGTATRRAGPGLRATHGGPAQNHPAGSARCRGHAVQHQVQRPDGVQPDRQWQDGGIPAAGLAYPAAPANRTDRSRARRVGVACCASPGARRARSQAAKRKDPTNPRHFKAAVPGARYCAPRGNWPSRLPTMPSTWYVTAVVCALPMWWAACPTSCRLPSCKMPIWWWQHRAPAGSAAFDADQARPGAVPGGGRSRPHAGPRFSDDLAEINQLTIERKQTMMFSATFAPRIQQLAARVMRAPQRVTIDNPQEKHANIKQVLFWADNAPQAQAPGPLAARRIHQPGHRFASTQIECDGLRAIATRGLQCRCLARCLEPGSAQPPPDGSAQRSGADSGGYRRGRPWYRRAHHHPCLFNYGLPMKAEDYTHRIGRTGSCRTRRPGVTFAEFRDRRRIFDIEAHTRQHFKIGRVAGSGAAPALPRSCRAPASFGGRGKHFIERPARSDRGFGDRSAPGWAWTTGTPALMALPMFPVSWVLAGIRTPAMQVNAETSLARMPPRPGPAARPGHAKPGNTGRGFVPKGAKARPGR